VCASGSGIRQASAAAVGFVAAIALLASDGTAPASGQQQVCVQLLMDHCVDVPVPDVGGIVPEPTPDGTIIGSDPDCADDTFIPEPDVRVLGLTASRQVGEEQALAIMTPSGPVGLSRLTGAAELRQGLVSFAMIPAEQTSWQVEGADSLSIVTESEREVVIATADGTPLVNLTSYGPVSMTAQGMVVDVTVDDPSGGVSPMGVEIVSDQAFTLYSNSFTTDGATGHEPTLLMCQPPVAESTDYGVPAVQTTQNHWWKELFQPVDDAIAGVASAAAPKWACSVFVGTPYLFGPEVRILSFQTCSGAFLDQTLRACIQMKKKFVFISYWDALRCHTKTTVNSYNEAEPYTVCRRGRHTYRGYARGSATPPPTASAPVRSIGTFVVTC
jgi:hypothetical protein